MAVFRSLVGAAALAVSLALPLPAGATSTGACAQRVIRDWYDGGRVDGVYPLRCYRAAIRALPEDVLSYSDARSEIERALSYARQGLADPGGADAAAAPAAPSGARGEQPAERRSELATRTHAAPERPEAPAEPGHAAAASVRPFDGPVDLAAAADPRAADARGLPYPVVVLGTLAALLLGTAAVARVLAGRRGREGPSDR